MKTLSAAILALSFSFPALAQGPGKAAGCQTCTQTLEAPQIDPAAAQELAALPKGRIENLIPMSMLIALGCDTCTEKAVQYALSQGSSPGDVDAALRTIAVVQKLDCFNHQFGGDAAARLEKPLAAARKALEQAAGR
jgi:hypothetical protein